MVVTADADAVSGCLQTLMRASGELLEAGFVVLHGQTKLTHNGKCLATVKLGGSGLLASPAVIDGVLQRLSLADDLSHSGTGRPRLRRASGSCAVTGASIRYASMPSEGVLLNVEWLFPIEGINTSPPPDAGQSVAWVIQDDENACKALMRRLERLGWSVVHFDGPTPAARRLRAMPLASLHKPSLVVAVECASVSPSSVQTLLPHLPQQTTALYKAVAGSPTLERRGTVPGFDVRMLPLSPIEIEAVTAAAVPGAAQSRQAHMWAA